MNAPLEKLLELSLAGREGDPKQVLDLVADTMTDAAGFATCVVSVYDPAWDEFERVVVRGPSAMQTASRRTRISADELAQIPAQGEEYLDGVFLMKAELADW